MQTLADIGEAGLIARIEARARRAARPWVVIGIGDDAAVVRPRAGEDLVVSADTLVEDVHFRFATQFPATVGRRALAVNLSDLAAMGARPLGCTLALSAPGELDVARALALVDGLVAGARVWGCPLVGGNVARARETSLAVTVFGALPRGQALRRGDVRVGDRVFVTGTLGRSALEWRRAEALGTRIRRVPEPRLDAGARLLRTRGHGGCVDLSDGLLAGLDSLLGHSGLGIDLQPEALPCSPSFTAQARRLGLDSLALQLSGGEDYELLFTLRAGTKIAGRLSGRLRLPTCEIGRVVASPGIHGIDGAARRQTWRHFDTPASRGSKNRRR